MVSFKANILATAKYGVQSTAPVISAWPELSSKGTTTYEVQLHSDGVLTCNCPGWVSRKSRDCRHVKEHAFNASMILQGKHHPEFVQSGTGVSSSVKVVEKVVEKVVFKDKIIEKLVPQKEPSVEVRGTKRLLRTIPSK